VVAMTTVAGFISVLVLFAVVGCVVGDRLIVTGAVALRSPSTDHLLVLPIFSDFYYELLRLCDAFF